MKLLVTSVGSVVGQNILDVLEFPAMSRRALVRVIGVNSLIDAPNNFRCDRCYWVPETAAAGYQARMGEILLEESPDLILCGRDEDTLALSELKAQRPGLPGALPVGTPQTALIGLDKWQTWQFTRRHGLPFAESFMLGQSGDRVALETFCQKVGYPMVAKPARGFASRGVYYLRDARDLESLAQRDGYILQEYLGDPRTLEPYFATFRGPPPLFAAAQETGHYSCQTMIAPNGDLAPVLATFNPTQFGMAPVLTRVSDPSLDALTIAYARALAEEGALGPVNVAFRRDRNGHWKVQEINLRTTGATHARFLLGMDELYLIVHGFVPGAHFPEFNPAEFDPPHHVSRYTSSYAVSESAVATLKEAGVWSSPLAVEGSAT